MLPRVDVRLSVSILFGSRPSHLKCGGDDSIRTKAGIEVVIVAGNVILSCPYLVSA